MCTLFFFPYSLESPELLTSKRDYAQPAASRTKNTNGNLQSPCHMHMASPISCSNVSRSLLMHAWVQFVRICRAWKKKKQENVQKTNMRETGFSIVTHFPRARSGSIDWILAETKECGRHRNSWCSITKNKYKKKIIKNTDARVGRGRVLEDQDVQSHVRVPESCVPSRPCLCVSLSRTRMTNPLPKLTPQIN